MITNDFPPRAGGIQAFVHGLVERQPVDSVVVFASAWKNSAAFDAQQSFQVIRHSESLMLPTPRVGRTVREIAAAEGCTRVLFGATAPLGLLAAGLRRAGAERLVGITHGHEAGWAQAPGTNRVIRRIGNSTDTITFLGEYTRRRIARALTPSAADRMRRLVPGVDDTVFNPANAISGSQIRANLGLGGRPVVVCISRLMPRKGQDTLIHAWPTVRKRFPDAALLLVGGGPYKQKLHQMVAANGLGNDVVITGSVPWDELPAHYTAGDIFAMPCRTRNAGWDVEGLGMVYLEASASGLPVIAGDSGGAPDAVVAGQTGIVVKGTSIRETADAIINLLADPGRARRMGETGREWVLQNWQWHQMATRLKVMLDGGDPDREPTVHP